MTFSKKKFALTLGILLLAGFAVPHFAHAGFMDSALADVVSYTVKFIAYIINFVGSILFGFAGSLVEFMLRMNLSVADTAKNALVNVGWQITRDIANLGFVLVMIVVAFTTIVGSESYGYKKLLPKLIAAAILVNFSLTIAGVFIDFSHVLTNFFMSKVSDTGYLGITGKLANAFGAQRFLLGDGNNPLPPNPSDEAGLGTKLSTAVVVSIAELGFIVLFTFAAAIVLLTLAVLLLVRFVYLSFLLVIAPIVWLFWVVPGMGNKLSQWWSKFIEWTFFAPAVTFFIYLALASVEALGSQYKSSEFFKAGALQAILASGSQMVVLIGILVGGLIAAQKMGIEGAAVGIDKLRGFGTVAKNYASARATDLGKRIAKSNTGKTISRLALQGGGKLKAVSEYKPTTATGKVAAFVAAPLRAVGGFAGSGLQTTIGGAESKPDSLGSMAWAAVTGGQKGVTSQVEKAKKEKAEIKSERTPQELTTEYQKMLERRAELQKNGAYVGGLNKDIRAMEAEIKKKTELPDNDDDLVAKIREFKDKRDELLAKGFDTSLFDAQIEKANTSLEKIRKIDAEKSVARKTWEEQASTLSTQRDAAISSGGRAPGTVLPIDADIETAKEQTKLWQKIENQKPKTRVQWQDRENDLRRAQTVAEEQKLKPDAIEKIKDLLADATASLREVMEKEVKGSKRDTERIVRKEGGEKTQVEKEKPQSPIVTTGFTEYTPIERIREDAAKSATEIASTVAKSTATEIAREQERIHRKERAEDVKMGEEGEEGPKIIS